jgi:hypothetical protein
VNSVLNSLVLCATVQTVRIKLVVLNNTLLVQPEWDPDALYGRPEAWGRLAENACIAFAWNAGQKVQYWCEEPWEVDFVRLCYAILPSHMLPHGQVLLRSPGRVSCWRGQGARILYRKMLQKSVYVYRDSLMSHCLAAALGCPQMMRSCNFGESVDAYGRGLRWTIGAPLSRVGRSFSEGGS